MEGTLRQYTQNYNPDTDINERIEVDYDISGMTARFNIRHIDGELIRQGDLKFYLSPLQVDQTTPTPTPQTTDRIVYDGVEYSIIQVKSWRFAGEDCGWSLQIRRT